MKDYNLQVRLSQAEKEALKLAAEAAGLSVSSWLRDRLRKAARTELQSSGKKVPFLEVANGR
jgi:predicted HicB family RNase H-like nuclease